MVLASPNGKALYLYQNHQLRPFPDFHTFTAMGFNAAEIKKMRSDIISKLPKGQALEVIAPPPEFRAEDYHYHSLCEDYPRLVNDLGVVANLGDFHRLGDLFSRARKHKKIEILALGGSITAGGYFEQFVRLLRTKEGLDVTVRNHGHGATELVYTLFCIEVEQYQPDLVLIDFSVNDYGHPKLMDALIRKSLSLGQNRPVVAMVNLWVAAGCPTTKYLAHGQYYNIPVLNLCPAVDLCYGKGRLPKWRWQEYSKDDGVHPWGPRGVSHRAAAAVAARAGAGKYEAFWTRVASMHMFLLDCSQVHLLTLTLTLTLPLLLPPSTPPPRPAPLRSPFWGRCCTPGGSGARVSC
jgi:hypothetical protein